MAGFTLDVLPAHSGIESQAESSDTQPPRIRFRAVTRRRFRKTPRYSPWTGWYSAADTVHLRWADLWREWP